MSNRPTVIVDPYSRKMAEIFSPADRVRLDDWVSVVWGQDEPMPIDAARGALPDALAVVCSNWRYGDDLAAAGHLRAILGASGAFPRDLDYDACFSRGIRVLSSAPAFAPQVAEMALGMALAASREIVAGDLAELLLTSRVTFVVATPTVENQALLTRELLQKIQPGSVLVLISRSHVVDFDALTELVLAGRFKAAIDVFPVEPLPANHPIRRAPGGVLSAHRAGSVPTGLWEIGRMIVDDLEALAKGLPPQCLQLAQPELIGRFPDR